MKKNLTALFLLAHALFCSIASIGQQATEPQKNYAIVPKLPPPPKAEPFTVSTIPLPANVVDAKLVNYLPDREHLIVWVHLAGSTKSDIAVMNEDGSGFKCLTCGLKEEIGDEMPVPLPDGKRVYTPMGVLECSPSILDCKEAKILPLVYPTIPGAKVLARIATNMSQDGIHVGYTLVVTRPIPLVLVSELTRVSDQKGERYEFTKTKVIAGNKMFDGDPARFRPFFFGNGEVKSFTGMGRYLSTITTFEANNYDDCKIDLTTGEISRFTRHFSYDEGVYPSPDGNWVIIQTHRHTKRMDAFGLIPRPLIAGTTLGGGIAEYRNEAIEGARDPRRYYGLTLLDQYGDRARLPEDGYTGQNLSTAPDDLTEYTHFGNFSWHPGSTRGIFWEQKDPKKVKQGEPLGRLRMIRFTSRKPTTPLKSFTPDLKWAQNLEDLKPLDATIPSEGKLTGAVSGYATISVQQPATGTTAEPLFKIEYVNFSDDGTYVLNGTELRTNKLFARESSWSADIQVTGKRKGFLKADNVHFYPNRRGSGTIRAQLGDYTVDVDLSKGLPTGVPGEVR